MKEKAAKTGPHEASVPQASEEEEVSPRYIDASIPGETDVSTTDMSHALHRQHARQMLKRFVVGCTAVFLIALAVALYTKSLSSLTPKTITNEGFAYTFKFYSSAQQTTLHTVTALKYGDKAVVQAQPTEDALITDCGQRGRAWKTAFRIPIEGVEHPVCSTGERAFYVNVEKYGTRHEFALTYVADQSSDLSIIEDIMRSFRVAR